MAHIDHHISLLPTCLLTGHKVEMNVTSIPGSAHGPYLPMELLSTIISSVTEKKELANLCLLSTKMYHVAIKELYKDLEFSSKSSSERGWSGIVVKKTELAHLVTSLTIKFGNKDKWPGTEIVIKILRCVTNLKAYAHLPNLITKLSLLQVRHRAGVRTSGCPL